jgi:putative transcriptional regulator
VKNRIKVFRAIHNLTQEELAHHLGVTRQTIQAIETGKYDPSLPLAGKIFIPPSKRSLSLTFPRNLLNEIRKTVTLG